MKILLTAIVKGDSEATLFKRMLESFMPYCDGLVVAITNPNETYAEIGRLVRRYKGYFVNTSPETHPEIYDKDGNFANFAAARNVTFQIADKEHGYDFYTWADTDDLLIGGEEFREVAQMAKDKDFDAVFFTYWYSIRVKDDGTFNENCVEIEHLRERLLKPHIFEWKSRLHEVAVTKDNYQPRITEYAYNTDKNQTIAWAHITQKERVDTNMERNIRILETQIEEEKYKDPRTVYYLAKTYFDMKNKDDRALELLTMYIHGKNQSGWAEERANAFQYIANIHSRNGRHGEAILALFEALKEYPKSHMHYLLLAKEYGELQQFQQSDFWLDVALHMDKPGTSTTIGNPLEIKYMAASLQYNRAWRMKQLDEALHWAQVRAKLAQEDDGLVEGIKEAKALNDSAGYVLKYAKWLKDHNYEIYIDSLLKALPPELGREPFAHYIANEIKKPTVWAPNTIVYFASWGGDHFEKWSPKSIEQGIGGSETAVIELAKQWAKMGWDVTVYGDPQEDAGDYDGVHYRPWYEINWKDEFNILILWRAPYLLDRDIKAKKIFYDAHDVESQLSWTDKRVEKVHKVMFKSKFHRSMVPKLPDDKAVIISNGISL